MSKKSFFDTLIDCLEMELNFVFLRAGAVRLYRPRAKNEKRQKRIELDVQYAFIIPSVTCGASSPCIKGSLIYSLFGVVQPIY